MAVELATGYINIVPSAKGIKANLEREISGPLANVADTAGKNFGSKFTDAVSSAVRSTAEVVATGFSVAAAGATAFAVAATLTAARASEMDVILQQLARTNGLSGDSVNAVVQAVKAQGIELGVAQNTVATFIRSNLDLADATKIARISQDAATLAGKNSSETLDLIIHGIQTQQIETLRQAGILVSAEDAFDAYGAAIGKAGKDLTPFEKQQAFVNAVIAQGATIAGSYEAAMTNASKVMRSIPRLLNDISVNVGQSFLPAFGDLVFTAYNGAKALDALTQQGTPLRKILDGIGATVQRLLAPLKTFAERIVTFLQNLTTADADRFLATLDKFLPVIAGIGAALGTMGAKNIPILGQFLSGVNPVVAALGALVLTSPPLRDALQKIFKALEPALKLVAGALGQAFTSFVDALKPSLPALSKALVEMAVALGRLVVAVVPILVPLTELAIILTTKLGVPVLLGLAAAMTAFMNAMTDHQELLIGFVAALATLAVPAIIAYTIAMWNAAAATIAATWPIVAAALAVGVLTAGVLLLWNNWDQIWTWIANHPALGIVAIALGSLLTGGLLPITLAVIELSKNWNEVWGYISSNASRVAGDIVRAFQPIIDTVTFIIDKLNDLKRTLKELSHVGSGNPDNPGDPLGLGPLFGFSQGGFVPGFGNRDTVPAMLTPGEFVISKAMMRDNAPTPVSAGSSGLNFNGPVTIGDRNVIPDLDYYAKTRMAGV